MTDNYQTVTEYNPNNWDGRKTLAENELKKGTPALKSINSRTRRENGNRPDKIPGQDGMVSFMVVMFISMLLVLITAGFAQVMIRELNQSVDNELSAMAYYATESAIEEGMLLVREALEAGDISGAQRDNCVNGTFSDTTGYSCLTIDTEPTSLEGHLPADISRQFNFTSISHDRIRLEWHQRGEGLDYEDLPDEPMPGTGDNPRAANWPDRVPAIMRLEIVSYQDGDFERDDVEQKVAFLRPVAGGGSVSVLITNINAGDNMKNVNCNLNVSTGGYACSLTVTGMERDHNYIVTLKPFYTGARYRLRALDGSITRNIPGNQVDIDATGYANDVFRRLKVHLPLHSDHAFGQHPVLMADEGICKDMRISRIPTRERADTNTGCRTPFSP